MWGISVYAGLGMPNIESYIRRSAELGAQKVFTSLHIPEASVDLMDEFLLILDTCAELDLTLYADISANYYAKFPFESYPNMALRLDFGFSDNEIVELSYKHKLVLNASTLTQPQAERLQALGLDWNNISACHNYYPRPETGISCELFSERNQLCASLGLEIDAFIVGTAWQRPPIVEGLPTIESHRGSSPLTAAQECLKLGASCVLFGDQASDSELQQMAQLQSGIWVLPVHWEDPKEHPLKNIEHQNRSDPGDGLIRSETSRGIVKKIAPENCVVRSKGSITVDNNLYGRYAGELQITSKEFPADSRVNVLGKVADNGHLTSYIAPQDKWIFYNMRQK